MFLHAEDPFFDVSSEGRIRQGDFIAPGWCFCFNPSPDGPNLRFPKVGASCGNMKFEP